MFTNRDIADFIIDDIEYNPTYCKSLDYYNDTDGLFENIRLERFIRQMYIIALEAFI